MNKKKHNLNKKNLLNSLKALKSGISFRSLLQEFHSLNTKNLNENLDANHYDQRII